MSVHNADLITRTWAQVRNNATTIRTTFRSKLQRRENAALASMIPESARQAFTGELVTIVENSIDHIDDLNRASGSVKQAAERFVDLAVHCDVGPPALALLLQVIKAEFESVYSLALSAPHIQAAATQAVDNSDGGQNDSETDSVGDASVGCCSCRKRKNRSKTAGRGGGNVSGSKRASIFSHELQNRPKATAKVGIETPDDNPSYQPTEWTSDAQQAWEQLFQFIGEALQQFMHNYARSKKTPDVSVEPTSTTAPAPTSVQPRLSEASSRSSLAIQTQSEPQSHAQRPASRRDSMALVSQRVIGDKKDRAPIQEVEAKDENVPVIHTTLPPPGRSSTSGAASSSIVPKPATMEASKSQMVTESKEVELATLTSQTPAGMSGSLSEETRTETERNSQRESLLSGISSVDSHDPRALAVGTDLTSVSERLRTLALPQSPTEPQTPPVTSGPNFSAKSVGPASSRSSSRAETLQCAENAQTPETDAAVDAPAETSACAITPLTVEDTPAAKSPLDRTPTITSPMDSDLQPLVATVRILKFDEPSNACTRAIRAEGTEYDMDYGDLQSPNYFNAVPTPYLRRFLFNTRDPYRNPPPLNKNTLAYVSRSSALDLPRLRHLPPAFDVSLHPLRNRAVVSDLTRSWNDIKRALPDFERLMYDLAETNDVKQEVYTHIRLVTADSRLSYIRVDNLRSPSSSIRNAALATHALCGPREPRSRADSFEGSIDKSTLESQSDTSMRRQSFTDVESGHRHAGDDDMSDYTVSTVDHNARKAMKSLDPASDGVQLSSLDHETKSHGTKQDRLDELSTAETTLAQLFFACLDATIWLLAESLDGAGTDRMTEVSSTLLQHAHLQSPNSARSASQSIASMSAASAELFLVFPQAGGENEFEDLGEPLAGKEDPSQRQLTSESVDSDVESTSVALSRPARPSLTQHSRGPIDVPSRVTSWQSTELLFEQIENPAVTAVISHSSRSSLVGSPFIPRISSLALFSMLAMPSFHPFLPTASEKHILPPSVCTAWRQLGTKITVANLHKLLVLSNTVRQSIDSIYGTSCPPEVLYCWRLLLDAVTSLIVQGIDNVTKTSEFESSMMFIRRSWFATTGSAVSVEIASTPGNAVEGGVKAPRPTVMGDGPPMRGPRGRRGSQASIDSFDQSTLVDGPVVALGLDGMPLTESEEQEAKKKRAEFAREWGVIMQRECQDAISKFKQGTAASSSMSHWSFLATTSQLQDAAAWLVNTLTTIIQNLEGLTSRRRLTHPAKVVRKEVLAIRARLVANGGDSSHFNEIARCLHHALALLLGPTCTNDVHAAWSLMLQAIEAQLELPPAQKVDVDSETTQLPRGVLSLTHYQALDIEDLTQDEQEVDMGAELDPSSPSADAFTKDTLNSAPQMTTMMRRWTMLRETWNNAVNFMSSPMGRALIIGRLSVVAPHLALYPKSDSQAATSEVNELGTDEELQLIVDNREYAATLAPTIVPGLTRLLPAIRSMRLFAPIASVPLSLTTLPPTTVVHVERPIEEVPERPDIDIPSLKKRKKKRKNEVVYDEMVSIANYFVKRPFYHVSAGSAPAAAALSFSTDSVDAVICAVLELITFILRCVENPYELGVLLNDSELIHQFSTEVINEHGEPIRIPSDQPKNPAVVDALISRGLAKIIEEWSYVQFAAHPNAVFLASQLPFSTRSVLLGAPLAESIFFPHQDSAYYEKHASGYAASEPTPVLDPRVPATFFSPAGPCGKALLWTLALALLVGSNSAVLGAVSASPGEGAALDAEQIIGAWTQNSRNNDAPADGDNSPQSPEPSSSPKVPSLKLSKSPNLNGDWATEIGQTWHWFSTWISEAVMAGRQRALLSVAYSRWCLAKSAAIAVHIDRTSNPIRQQLQPQRANGDEVDSLDKEVLTALIENNYFTPENLIDASVPCSNDLASRMLPNTTYSGKSISPAQAIPHTFVPAIDVEHETIPESDFELFPVSGWSRCGRVEIQTLGKPVACVLCHHPSIPSYTTTYTSTSGFIFHSPRRTDSFRTTDEPSSQGQQREIYEPYPDLRLSPYTINSLSNLDASGNEHFSMPQARRASVIAKSHTSLFSRTTALGIVAENENTHQSTESVDTNEEGVERIETADPLTFLQKPPVALVFFSAGQVTVAHGEDLLRTVTVSPDFDVTFIPACGTPILIHSRISGLVGVYPQMFPLLNPQPLRNVELLTTADGENVESRQTLTTWWGPKAWIPSAHIYYSVRVADLRPNVDPFATLPKLADLPTYLRGSGIRMTCDGKQLTEQEIEAEDSQFSEIFEAEYQRWQKAWEKAQARLTSRQRKLLEGFFVVEDPFFIIDEQQESDADFQDPTLVSGSTTPAESPTELGEMAARKVHVDETASWPIVLSQFQIAPTRAEVPPSPFECDGVFIPPLGALAEGLTLVNPKINESSLSKTKPTLNLPAQSLGVCMFSRLNALWDQAVADTPECHKIYAKKIGAKADENPSSSKLTKSASALIPQDRMSDVKSLIASAPHPLPPAVMALIESAANADALESIRQEAIKGGCPFFAGAMEAAKVLGCDLEDKPDASTLNPSHIIPPIYPSSLHKHFETLMRVYFPKLCSRLSEVLVNLPLDPALMQVPEGYRLDETNGGASVLTSGPSPQADASKVITPLAAVLYRIVDLYALMIHAASAASLEPSAFDLGLFWSDIGAVIASLAEKNGSRVTTIGQRIAFILQGLSETGIVQELLHASLIPFSLALVIAAKHDHVWNYNGLIRTIFAEATYVPKKRTADVSANETQIDRLIKGLRERLVAHGKYGGFVRHFEDHTIGPSSTTAALPATLVNTLEPLTSFAVYWVYSVLNCYAMKVEVDYRIRVAHGAVRSGVTMSSFKMGAPGPQANASVTRRWGCTLQCVRDAITREPSVPRPAIVLLLRMTWPRVRRMLLALTDVIYRALYFLSPESKLGMMDVDQLQHVTALIGLLNDVLGLSPLGSQDAGESDMDGNDAQHRSRKPTTDRQDSKRNVFADLLGTSWEKSELDSNVLVLDEEEEDPQSSLWRRRIYTLEQCGARHTTMYYMQPESLPNFAFALLGVLQLCFGTEWEKPYEPFVRAVNTTAQSANQVLGHFDKDTPDLRMASPNEATKLFKALGSTDGQQAQAHGRITGVVAKSLRVCDAWYQAIIFVCACMRQGGTIGLRHPPVLIPGLIEYNHRNASSNHANLSASTLAKIGVSDSLSGTGAKVTKRDDKYRGEVSSSNHHIGELDGDDDFLRSLDASAGPRSGRMTGDIEIDIAGTAKARAMANKIAAIQSILNSGVVKCPFMLGAMIPVYFPSLSQASSGLGGSSSAPAQQDPLNRINEAGFVPMEFLDLPQEVAVSDTHPDLSVFASPLAPVFTHPLLLGATDSKYRIVALRQMGTEDTTLDLLTPNTDGAIRPYITDLPKEARDDYSSHHAHMRSNADALETTDQTGAIASLSPRAEDLQLATGGSPHSEDHLSPRSRLRNNVLETLLGTVSNGCSVASILGTMLPSVGLKVTPGSSRFRSQSGTPSDLNEDLFSFFAPSPVPTAFGVQPPRPFDEDVFSGWAHPRRSEFLDIIMEDLQTPVPLPSDTLATSAMSLLPPPADPTHGPFHLAKSAVWRVMPAETLKRLAPLSMDMGKVYKQYVKNGVNVNLSQCSTTLEGVQKQKTQQTAAARGQFNGSLRDYLSLMVLRRIFSLDARTLLHFAGRKLDRHTGVIVGSIERIAHTLHALNHANVLRAKKMGQKAVRRAQHKMRSHSPDPTSTPAPFSTSSSFIAPALSPTLSSTSLDRVNPEALQITEGEPSPGSVFGTVGESTHEAIQYLCDLLTKHGELDADTHKTLELMHHRVPLAELLRRLQRLVNKSSITPEQWEAAVALLVESILQDATTPRAPFPTPQNSVDLQELEKYFEDLDLAHMKFGIRPGFYITFQTAVIDAVREMHAAKRNAEAEAQESLEQKGGQGKDLKAPLSELGARIFAYREAYSQRLITRAGLSPSAIPVTGQNTRTGGAATLSDSPEKAFQRRMDYIKNIWTQVMRMSKAIGKSFWNHVLAISEEANLLFRSVNAEALQKAFLDMITDVVENITSDTLGVVTRLRAAGARHLAYRATPESFEFHSVALLQTIAKAIPDQWNERAEMCFQWLMDFVIVTMLEGMQEHEYLVNQHRAEDANLALIQRTWEKLSTNMPKYMKKIGLAFESVGAFADAVKLAAHQLFNPAEGKSFDWCHAVIQRQLQNEIEQILKLIIDNARSIALDDSASQGSSGEHESVDVLDQLIENAGNDLSQIVQCPFMSELKESNEGGSGLAQSKTTVPAEPMSTLTTPTTSTTTAAATSSKSPATGSLKRGAGKSAASKHTAQHAEAAIEAQARRKFVQGLVERFVKYMNTHNVTMEDYDRMQQTFLEVLNDILESMPQTAASLNIERCTTAWAWLLDRLRSRVEARVSAAHEVERLTQACGMLSKAFKLIYPGAAPAPTIYYADIPIRLTSDPALYTSLESYYTQLGITGTPRWTGEGDDAGLGSSGFGLASGDASKSKSEKRLDGTLTLPRGALVQYLFAKLVLTAPDSPKRSRQHQRKKGVKGTASQDSSKKRGMALFGSEHVHTQVELLWEIVETAVASGKVEGLRASKARIVRLAKRLAMYNMHPNMFAFSSQLFTPPEALGRLENENVARTQKSNWLVYCIDSCLYDVLGPKRWTANHSYCLNWICRAHVFPWIREAFDSVAQHMREYQSILAWSWMMRLTSHKLLRNRFLTCRLGQTSALLLDHYAAAALAEQAVASSSATGSKSSSNVQSVFVPQRQVASLNASYFASAMMFVGFRGQQLRVKKGGVPFVPALLLEIEYFDTVARLRFQVNRAILPTISSTATSWRETEVLQVRSANRRRGSGAFVSEPREESSDGLPNEGVTGSTPRPSGIPSVDGRRSSTVGPWSYQQLRKVFTKLFTPKRLSLVLPSVDPYVVSCAGSIFSMPEASQTTAGKMSKGIFKIPEIDTSRRPLMDALKFGRSDALQQTGRSSGPHPLWPTTLAEYTLQATAAGWHFAKHSRKNEPVPTPPATALLTPFHQLLAKVSEKSDQPIFASAFLYPGSELPARRTLIAPLIYKAPSPNPEVAELKGMLNMKLVDDEDAKSDVSRGQLPYQQYRTQAGHDASARSGTEDFSTIAEHSTSPETGKTSSTPFDTETNVEFDILVPLQVLERIDYYHDKGDWTSGVPNPSAVRLSDRKLMGRLEPGMMLGLVDDSLQLDKRLAYVSHYGPLSPFIRRIAPGFILPARIVTFTCGHSTLGVLTFLSSLVSTFEHNIYDSETSRHSNPNKRSSPSQGPSQMSVTAVHVDYLYPSPLAAELCAFERNESAPASVISSPSAATDGMMGDQEGASKNRRGSLQELKSDSASGATSSYPTVTAGSIHSLRIAASALCILDSKGDKPVECHDRAPRNATSAYFSAAHRRRIPSLNQIREASAAAESQLDAAHDEPDDQQVFEGFINAWKAKLRDGWRSDEASELHKRFLESPSLPLWVGLPTTEMLQALLLPECGRWSDQIVYVEGPKAFVDYMRHILSRIGVSLTRMILVEYDS